MTCNSHTFCLHAQIVVVFVKLTLLLILVYYAISSTSHGIYCDKWSSPVVINGTCQNIFFSRGQDRKKRQPASCFLINSILQISIQSNNISIMITLCKRWTQSFMLKNFAYFKSQGIRMFFQSSRFNYFDPLFSP